MINIMRNRISLTVLCLVSFFSLQAQKNQEVLDFIEKLPTIEYGTMPYWIGADEDRSYIIVHGFPPTKESDALDIDKYNSMMKSALCDKSYTIKGKDTLNVRYDHVEFTPIVFDEVEFFDDKRKQIERPFTSVLFASAKSVYLDKFYVVYFHRVIYTETVAYYAVVFDNNGHILSYMHLDYWSSIPPYYPLHSKKNKEIRIDYSKCEVMFLPNGILYTFESYVTAGGGLISLSRLNSKGHYEKLVEWEVNDGGYYCPNGYDEMLGDDGRKNFSPFVVVDPDGYSNVRKQNNTKSEVLRRVNDGDVVFGSIIKNNWLKIDVGVDAAGNITHGGYIHMSRLKQIGGWCSPSHPERADWEKKINEAKKK